MILNHVQGLADLAVDEVSRRSLVARNLFVAKLLFRVGQQERVDNCGNLTRHVWQV